MLNAKNYNAEGALGGIECEQKVKQMMNKNCCILYKAIFLDIDMPD